LVAPMSDCTTSSGHGADVFPRWRSRTLRACVSRVFVATCFQRHCSIARLRRCEPPPSADVFSRSDVPQDGLRNCAHGVPCSPG
jgi:hypothetical protein